MADYIPTPDDLKFLAEARALCPKGKHLIGLHRLVEGERAQVVRLTLPGCPEATMMAGPQSPYSLLIADDEPAPQACPGCGREPRVDLVWAIAGEECWQVVCYTPGCLMHSPERSTKRQAILVHNRLRFAEESA